MPVIRRGENHHRDMPGTGIALQAGQHLNSRASWQIQVEDHEVGLGMSGLLCLPRWQKVVQRYLSIVQENDGIGEVRPSQIALDQARMTRIVFYYQ
jgi:hypothetical protein